jgi:hypothetical protein
VEEKREKKEETIKDKKENNVNIKKLRENTVIEITNKEKMIKNSSLLELRSHLFPRSLELDFLRYGVVGGGRGSWGEARHGCSFSDPVKQGKPDPAVWWLSLDPTCLMAHLIECFLSGYISAIEFFLCVGQE